MLKLFIVVILYVDLPLARKAAHGRGKGLLLGVLPTRSFYLSAPGLWKSLFYMQMTVVHTSWELHAVVDGVMVSLPGLCVYKDLFAADLRMVVFRAREKPQSTLYRNAVASVVRTMFPTRKEPFLHRIESVQIDKISRSSPP